MWETPARDTGKLLSTHVTNCIHKYENDTVGVHLHVSLCNWIIIAALCVYLIQINLIYIIIIKSAVDIIIF